jgi:hypothetical protein
MTDKDKTTLTLILRVISIENLISWPGFGCWKKAETLVKQNTFVLKIGR